MDSASQKTAQWPSSRGSLGGGGVASQARTTREKQMART